jgi:hypothetical protein
MKLTITNKDQFLNEFLTPISKVGDSAVIKVENSTIKALLATSDNTVIVSAEYNEPANKSTKQLNIPDVKKLCRILQCIDAQSIELDLAENNISYTSQAIRFKYHLYDDSIISVPKLNLAKLEQLDFNGQFTISQSTVLALIKGSSIATDTDKIYISFKNDDTVYGELTDKARANVDSYGLQIASDYVGVPVANSIPLNFEIFRIISSMKFNQIHSKIATATGVFVFSMKTDNTQLKFVVSALAN